MKIKHVFRHGTRKRFRVFYAGKKSEIRVWKVQYAGKKSVKEKRFWHDPRTVMRYPYSAHGWKGLGMQGMAIRKQSFV